MGRNRLGKLGHDKQPGRPRSALLSPLFAFLFFSFFLFLSRLFMRERSGCFSVVGFYRLLRALEDSEIRGSGR